MHVSVEYVLSREELAELYPIYAEAWDKLLIHAAARHVLSEAEFSEEMLDARIEKIIVRDDDGVFAGMTTLTNDMSAIPWVNPRHYATRYPDAAGRNALFYLGYMFIDQDHRHRNLMKLMAGAIDERLSGVGGVVGFDICSFNIEHGLGRRMASLLGASDRIDSLDTQTYYAADYRGINVASVPTTALTDVYEVKRLADRPEMVEDISRLLVARWPAYLLFGQTAHGIDLEKLMLRTADQQILLFDAYDSLCGVGFSIPLWWDGTVEGLPTGRDDAIQQSFQLLEEERTPNAVCALTVTISPHARGHGLAGRVIGGMKAAAEQIGAADLLVPVRPLRKSRYPLTPVGDFLSWRTESGELFDPTLRAHAAHGGAVLGVAPRSIVVSGRVSEWEKWAGLSLPATGDYIFDGGLSPLSVDREADRAAYAEPAIWVRHAIPGSQQEWVDEDDVVDDGIGLGRQDI